MIIPLLLPLALAAALDTPPEKRFDAVVSVASRSAQPAREVAGTVSLIERERMDQTLVQDLADAVRYEPGVSAPEDAARFGIQGFSIRGLSGNRVGIEIDGVPVADGFAIGSFSNASRGAIETAFLSRMEILRGPASTLYGSDALAGVVSMRTLSPEDLLSAQGDIGLRAETNALSRDGSVAVTGVSAWRGGAFEVLAGVVRRQGEERENMPRDGGLESNPADRDERSEMLKFGYDGAGIGRYQLMLDRTDEQVDSEIDSLVGGPGQYATTTEMLGDDQFQRERLSLGGDWSFDVAGLDSLSSTLYSQRSRTEQRTLQTRAAVPPRTPQTLRDRTFLFKTDSTGLDVQAEGRFDALGARHWQVYGIEYSQTDLNELRDALETNLSTGQVTNVLIGERFPVRDFPPSTATEFGAFWQDEIRPGDGALAIIPGIRYERFRVDSKSDAIYLADNPNVTPVDLSESQFTPKLGVRYELSHSTQLFGQYALGFRAPPVSDVNLGFNIPAFNYVAIPNPELKPEHSQGFEIGARMSGEFSSFELALFDNHYRDLIESRANLGRDPVSGALVFQSINRDRAHIYGAELRGEVSLPWEGFAVNGALAWTHGDDTARDVPLNSVDPGKLTMGLSYDSLSGRHRLELVATAVSAKSRVDDSTVDVFRTPGYATLDAYWRIQVADRLQVDIGAFNLTDRRYWLWSGVKGLPADAREIDLYTQPGRQIGASVRYAW
ncbi:MAG TPA: TonB-dependent hemoglobin/transferrin/lactoferrin family receptor [Xanthomonadales bacterium]|nr:TonB-dependent hemoglobin/transferrin/lactoferrin family receptor [Xanthomonadales bacterium]